MTTTSQRSSIPMKPCIMTILSLALSRMAIVEAWYSPSASRSAFTGRSLVSSLPSSLASSSMVMYDNRSDPPNDNTNNDSPSAWTVLANTEKWIASTLENAQGTAAENPYARKEVSYVCEAASESAMVVANLFRRVKEARELGENHGQSEVDRAEEAGSSYRPSTLRQTQVMVIPSNEYMTNDFSVFNAVIETINQARRHARDYVTESHWDRMDSREAEEPDAEWSVSVNVAHLHPEFGKKTPEEELQELKEQEEAGEVDVNYLEYLERRNLARRSPYPTVVIEVRATPPPDFGQASPPPMAETAMQGASQGESDISSEDIMKLEQLFGKSAHLNHPTKHSTAKQEEEAFYSAIGSTIEELTSVNSLQLAQNFIAAADHSAPETAAFTESDTAEVDEAYEFVFTNIAMMTETIKMAQEGQLNDVRHYVVLPRFVTSAATSLEKFSQKVVEIANTLPDLNDRLNIQTYHPEHIHEAQRSPVPIVMLQWKFD